MGILAAKSGLNPRVAPVFALRASAWRTRAAILRMSWWYKETPKRTSLVDRMRLHSFVLLKYVYLRSAKIE
eukprot:scaffold7359_cov255-Pinguiococcus_pyrenoidosus.AAC.6